MDSSAITDADLHPLSCPRCGCTESVVLETRRMTASREAPSPLPGIRRRRLCRYCEKQFRTIETLEEVDLVSAVWKVVRNVDRQSIDPATLLTGEYRGEWTQHEVAVEIDGEAYTLHTRNMMRTEAYPARVIVERQGVSVESVRG